MKLTITHKGTTVTMDDGYNADEYRALFQYSEATKRIQETISKFISDVNQVKQ